MFNRIDAGYDDILPSEINIDPEQGFEHLWNSLGSIENELSAYWLVKLAQIQGGWGSFTYEEIEAVYRTFGHLYNYTFNGLVRGGFIEQDGERYYFTDEFVRRVYESSPIAEDRAGFAWILQGT